MPKLSATEIKTNLSNLRGWTQEADTISKKFEFESFPKAIEFVNRVADAAERDDHHPDILISYRKVALSLSTHSEGGITQKDFDLANGIERLVRGE